MIKVHPYEEVAYDVYPLEIKGRQYGMEMWECLTNLRALMSL